MLVWLELPLYNYRNHTFSDLPTGLQGKERVIKSCAHRTTPTYFCEDLVTHFLKKKRVGGSNKDVESYRQEEDMLSKRVSVTLSLQVRVLGCITNAFFCQ